MEQKAPEDQNDKLRSRIARLEAIFNNIPEGVIVTNRDGRIVFSNRMATELLGYLPDDVKPLNWPEVFGFYLDDEETYFPSKSMPLARVLQGEPGPTEEMILRANESQTSIWLSMSSQSLRNEGGESSGAIVIFRDITYRKKVEISREKHARRSEALSSLSRSIAEIGDDLPQIMNIVATHASNYIGDACVATLVIPNRDRLKVAAIHHPEPSARAMLKELMMTREYELQGGLIGGVIESGEPLLIPAISPEQLAELTLPDFASYIRENGGHSLLIVPIPSGKGVLGTLWLSRDRAGKPYTAEDQSFLTDIAQRTELAIEHSTLIDSLRREVSERQEAEKALGESEVRFQSIFESTTLGIKVLALDGSILQTNWAFQGMLGYSEAELSGRHFIEFVQPEDSGRTLKFFEGLKTGNARGFRLQHRLNHKDGSVVWVNATFTSVRQNGEEAEPAFVVGIVENITEHKRMELEMVEIKNRLQDNLEMERLSLAQELHDGPMQELYSAIYQIEGLGDGVAPEYHETLQSVKQEIQTVVEELRSTAKELRPPALANFGLEKAIRSHIEDFQEKHPDIKIKLALATDRQLLPESVRLALFRIYQQALANLVRHAEASEVCVHFTFDAEEARLEITDNGKGFDVPPSWVLFTRQGHFGLAGAAERVEAFGGTFTVESQPGKGTTIKAVFPRSGFSELSSS